MYMINKIVFDNDYINNKLYINNNCVLCDTKDA